MCFLFSVPFRFRRFLGTCQCPKKSDGENPSLIYITARSDVLCLLETSQQSSSGNISEGKSADADRGVSSRKNRIYTTSSHCPSKTLLFLSACTNFAGRQNHPEKRCLRSRAVFEAENRHPGLPSLPGDYRTTRLGPFIWSTEVIQIQAGELRRTSMYLACPPTAMHTQYAGDTQYRVVPCRDRKRKKKYRPRRKSIASSCLANTTSVHGKCWQIRRRGSLWAHSIACNSRGARPRASYPHIVGMRLLFTKYFVYNPNRKEDPMIWGATADICSEHVCHRDRSAQPFARRVFCSRRKSSALYSFRGTHSSIFLQRPLPLQTIHFCILSCSRQLVVSLSSVSLDLPPSGFSPLFRPPPLAFPCATLPGTLLLRLFCPSGSLKLWRRAWSSHIGDRFIYE